MASSRAAVPVRLTVAVPVAVTPDWLTDPQHAGNGPHAAMEATWAGAAPASAGHAMAIPLGTAWVIPALDRDAPPTPLGVGVGPPLDDATAAMDRTTNENATTARAITIRERA